MSAVLSSDGTCLHTALDPPVDQPDFVNRLDARFGGAFQRDQVRVTWTLESLLTWMHADSDLKVQVSQAVPGGVFIGWSPDSETFAPALDGGRLPLRDGALGWSSLELLTPADHPDLSQVAAARDWGDHAASAGRSVPSAWLRSGEQVDRFLFAEGFLDLSLDVGFQVDDRSVRLWNDSEHDFGELLIIDVVGDQAGYAVVERLDADGLVDRRRPIRQARGVDEVKAEVDQRLHKAMAAAGAEGAEIDAGLGERVDRWFGAEGLHVVGLLPPPHAQAALPLTLDPAPRSLTQVILMDLQLLTPAQVDAVRSRLYDEPPAAALQAEFGAITEPALWQIWDVDKLLHPVAERALRELRPATTELRRQAGARGEPVILGGVDRVVLRQVMDESMGHFVAWAVEHGGKGHLVVKFVVGDDGAVTEVSTKSGGLGSAEAESCLYDEVRVLRFPPPQGEGEAVVAYTFAFSP